MGSPSHDSPKRFETIEQYLARNGLVSVLPSLKDTDLTFYRPNPVNPKGQPMNPFENGCLRVPERGGC